MKKKILFISHDSYLYGASRSLVDLASNIQLINEYEVWILIPQQGSIEVLLKEKKLNYKILRTFNLIHSNRKSNELSRHKKLWFNIRQLRNEIKLINEINPEVVYINTMTAYWHVLLSLFIKKPFIFHIREFGDLDYNILPDFKLFFKIALKKTKVLANSNAISDYLYRIYKIKAEVIYNGIANESQFQLRLKKVRKNKLSSDLYSFGIVGVINSSKGQMMALEAVNELKKHTTNFKLNIIGGGDSLLLLKYIEENSLHEFVHFTGVINNMEEWYNKLDCVIICSKNEAFGRVAVESLSYGIPVLGYNNGGTKEIINSNTGILFEDTTDLSKYMFDVIMNYKKHLKLAFNGWCFCKDTFSMEKNTSKFYSILKEQEQASKIAKII